MKNIAIIGAGFGGMSAAWDLCRAGHKVTIFEAEATPGGLAGGFKQPHWDWAVDKFYHHWFESDQHMKRLFRELGVTEKVMPLRPYTVMLHKERFYPFDSVLAALLYPGLGYGINKIRFGLVGLYLRLTKNWKPMEKTTVEAWMRKHAGNRVYEEMWEPMVIGKFGERFAREVNMAWMWARLHARTTRLVTYRGGFQAFADDFARILTEHGVEFRYSSSVERVASRPDGGLTLTVKGRELPFDACLSTVSPAAMVRMAPDLPDDYLDGLLSMKSLGAVVMVLALKQQLSKEGYYWFNLPKTAGFPFLALVEHTNFLSPEYFGGDHIVYCGDYLEAEHEYFSMTKEQLLEKFLPSLKRINPEFDPSWVRESWLFQTKYAQPVPLLNHSRNIPAVRTPMNGLYFASMSQVYPWDRGTNFAVELGRRAAEIMQP